MDATPGPRRSARVASQTPAPAGVSAQPAAKGMAAPKSRARASGARSQVTPVAQSIVHAESSTAVHSSPRGAGRARSNAPLPSINARESYAYGGRARSNLPDAITDPVAVSFGDALDEGRAAAVDRDSDRESSSSVRSFRMRRNFPAAINEVAEPDFARDVAVPANSNINDTSKSFGSVHETGIHRPGGMGQTNVGGDDRATFTTETIRDPTPVRVITHGVSAVLRRAVEAHWRYLLYFLVTAIIIGVLGALCSFNASCKNTVASYNPLAPIARFIDQEARIAKLEEENRLFKSQKYGPVVVESGEIPDGISREEVAGIARDAAVQAGITEERVFEIARDAFAKVGMTEENLKMLVREVGITQEDVKALARDEATEVAKEVANHYFHNRMPGAIQKLFKQFIKHERPANDVYVFDPLRTVNFFSPSLGVVIHPYLTSPTYEKPRSLGHRIYQSFISLPAPHPPMAALERWNEAGDCWCTAMEPIGRAQIGILLPNPVYPEYLTIEHIPKPETLDIKAAPRVVQLWGEVFSAQSRADIMAQLESSPGWVREDCTNPPSPNYVCLGVFRYNAMFEAADDPPRKKHIQSFKLDVDLASIDVSIKAAVVRVLHNYGQIYTCLYRLRLHGQTIATT